MKLLAIAVALLLPAQIAPATVPPADPAAESVPPATENPFLPEDEDVGDCISALPQPDCGSEERGEPIQFVLLAIVVAALAFITWRITRAVRARDRATSPEP